MTPAQQLLAKEAAQRRAAEIEQRTGIIVAIIAIVVGLIVGVSWGLADNADEARYATATAAARLTPIPVRVVIVTETP